MVDWAEIFAVKVGNMARNSGSCVSGISDGGPLDEPLEEADLCSLLP
jgi:hypothetical protein